MTCKTKKYDVCLFSEVNLPSWSKLSYLFDTKQEQTQELYNTITEIREYNNLSYLQYTCSELNGIESGFREFVEKTVELVEQLACEKESDDIYISKWGIQFRCLEDPCGKPITTLKKLVQLLIDKYCEEIPVELIKPESRIETTNPDEVTGIATLKITNSMTDGSNVLCGKCATIEVRKKDGTLIETLTGVTGGLVSAFTTSLTSGTSVLNHLPSNSVLSPCFSNTPTFLNFDRKTWAADNNHDCTDCTDLKFVTKIGVDGTCTSANTDNFAFIGVGNITGSGNYYDADFDFDDNLIFADGGGLKVRTLNKDTLCSATIGGNSVFVTGVSVDVTSGSGNDRIYAANLATNYISLFDNTNRADKGGSGTPISVTVNSSFAGLNVCVDNSVVASGRASVWALGNAASHQLYLLQWNGSSYAATNFSSLITSLSGAATIGLTDAVVDSNGVIWILGSLSGYTNRIIKLEKTGGGAYNQTSEWTASYSFGMNGTSGIIEATSGGDVDGAGNVAKTRRIACFDIYGYDGVKGATSGTTPMFLLANVENDSLRVVHFTGSDESDPADWTIYTPASFGGLNAVGNYDTYGVGNVYINGTISVKWNRARTKLYQLGWNNPNISNIYRPITVITNPEQLSQNRKIVFGKKAAGTTEQTCY